jgi:acetylornithine deacetylase
MHKGILMESIRIRGSSGHSSDPGLGSSALEGMHRVIGELLNWRDELQARYQQPLFKVPTPTLNLGHIHGGDNPNRICGECELHIDLRPLPGMEAGELRTEMQARLQHALRDSGLQLQIKPLFSGISAFESSANSEIVRIAEQLTGHSAEAVAFGTEAPFLKQLGIETIVMGPGDIDQAHQPNEYLSLKYITPCVTLLKNLIQKFCLRT